MSKLQTGLYVLLSYLLRYFKCRILGNTLLRWNQEFFQSLVEDKIRGIVNDLNIERTVINTS